MKYYRGIFVIQLCNSVPMKLVANLKPNGGHTNKKLFVPQYFVTCPKDLCTKLNILRYFKAKG